MHKKCRPRFWPLTALEVRSDLIRSPILGGPEQLMAIFLIFGIKYVVDHFYEYYGHMHIKLNPILV